MLTLNTKTYNLTLDTQKKGIYALAGGCQITGTKAMHQQDVAIFLCSCTPISNKRYGLRVKWVRPSGLPVITVLLNLTCEPFLFLANQKRINNLLDYRRCFMHNPTTTPTVSNSVSSIPQETYYTISLGKKAGTMSIIVKYHADSQQWRFVDISAGITFLINPDTNSIDFSQQAHDKAIELFSNELKKFVSQKLYHSCGKDSHTTITLEQTKLIGEQKMTNELMIFEGHEVEVFELNDQVLFNPKHVGACLDIEEGTVKNHISKMNPKQAVRVTGEEVSRLTGFRSLSNNGETFLTESGVYKLIFKSRKPEAEKFQEWVTDEVLPSIRKTGMYQMPNHNQSEFSWDMDAKKSNNVYLAMSKIIEIADRTLGGKVALRALNFFAGMPVDDLVDEIDERNFMYQVDDTSLDWVKKAVENFIVERCEIGADFRTQATVVYKAFSAWCQSQGIKKAVSQKKFGQFMLLHFDRVKYQTIFYIGFRLKDI